MSQSQYLEGKTKMNESISQNGHQGWPQDRPNTSTRNSQSIFDVFRSFMYLWHSFSFATMAASGTASSPIGACVRCAIGPIVFQKMGNLTLTSNEAKFCSILHLSHQCMALYNECPGTLNLKASLCFQTFCDTCQDPFHHQSISFVDKQRQRANHASYILESHGISIVIAAAMRK